VDRILPCGLHLVAESSIPTRATLRIFFDPARFRAWTEQFGNVSLLYADPLGIELTYKEGIWAFFVEEERLSVDFSAEKSLEVGCFRIEKEGVTRELTSKDSVPPIADPGLGSPTEPRPASRILGGPEANSAREGDAQVSRLLEALQESQTRS